LHSIKAGITAQKEPAGDKTGDNREDVLEIHNTATVLHSSDQQHRQEPSQQKQQQSLGKNTHRDTNQISDQSMKAKNVNNNATGNVFLCLHYGAADYDRAPWCCDGIRKGCCHY
jgi:hypothetical protein